MGLGSMNTRAFKRLGGSGQGVSQGGVSPFLRHPISDLDTPNFQNFTLNYTGKYKFETPYFYIFL